MDKYIKFSPDTNSIQMIDYKLEAAKASLVFIKSGQIIGLGAGSTIVHLINLISEKEELAASITFVSSSFKTRAYLIEKKLKVLFSSTIAKIDIYFDGCDQFDPALNALKSGGGIHTSEKILASMADEFILMGDESKMAIKLDHTYPLVIEVLQEALPVVLNRIRLIYPAVSVQLRMSNQKDGALISDNGNLLADVYFTELPELRALNIAVKMIPGIVDHSLFYGMATKAVIAGKNGTRVILPV
ncbi:ribose 5-phosphate isomerase A [Pedobacter cryoconitis]|uniref:Ribose 5-phosphate isomerase A n=1 Tax=Pedobacter cryoconitis TaxID=188932 RepID=A0A7W8ZQ00_9SPHI|nr:ribose 5-phosphate isomerase A [Pedobacter cryoconitis]MBB5637865.1 ribose 5-phosphate isomerase A [Pedobacter cryoconitis]